jgi:deoxyribose-phosphate aldolase
MTPDMASRVELLLAKPYPTGKDLEAHCSQARLQGYRSVTVPSSLVELAYDTVAESGVKVCCLIGYPFGQSDPDAKRYECELAVDFGAHEIELVPSIARLAEENYNAVLREIRDIVATADERSVRVSIEQLLWSDEQLREIVSMVFDSGAQYITTSVAPPLGRALTVADVENLRNVVGAGFGLKVGGLRTAESVAEFVSAGADRIGVLA